ncbi:molecular chaperone [Serratia fonticola]|uniref:fimbrial biogenesis chaperone n=1 Tax=Serratia fonticola TaxID=47917 RepID=UPI001376D6C5|nr:molecular chaperone [Serratia fonticola]NCG54501.1 fimbria/pilus periplasmic chaperone [Serratia fonticola]
MTRLFLVTAALATSLTFPLTVWGEGFGINATRLIYPQGERSITATVRNTLPAQPYLVQAGVSASREGAPSALFTVTPPLFRLEPNSTNHIRIAGNTGSLPTDRESVFYFHTRAIPGSQAPADDKSTAGVSGNVQLGVGNTIKLFYRPSGLSSTSAQAQKRLQFTRSVRGLRVSNPSPYFVSLAGISVAGQPLKLDTPGALMLSPFGEYTYPTALKAGSVQVQWKTINDLGGIDAFTHSLP